LCEEAKLVIAGEADVHLCRWSDGQGLILLYLFRSFWEHCQCLKLKLPPWPWPSLPLLRGTVLNNGGIFVLFGVFGYLSTVSLDYAKLYICQYKRGTSKAWIPL